MDDITVALNKLSLMQMVLAWAFVGCYALSLGGMLGPRGSRRAAMTALVSALVFCVLADNWVHGAVLVAFAVAGMGVFVAAAWSLARVAAWSIHREQRPETVITAPTTRHLRLPPLGGMLRALWRWQA